MPTENALHHESSLYLRQHATNPVAWHAWNEETLQKARAEKKPILLSIGYSACHWCHVMAHESFENVETARIMNTHFINIKVDKEERPDLDKIYQSSLQLLTRRTGGWPLTIFLHYEDLSPFFGGTYFPDTPRYGMPSFEDVLERVSRYFTERQDEIASHRKVFKEALSEMLAPAKKSDAVMLNDSPLNIARHQLGGSYDPRFSGFGLAPKFPHPQHLERLLLHWHASLSTKEDPGAYNMSLETLRTLARSGLYDQLGGGFFRYSVDEEWKIPHFEKMLYDNGLLLSVYAMAYSITEEVIFKEVIVQTAQWLKREMRNAQGAFYASIDADSEGKEGLFYVWDEKELLELLSSEEIEFVRGYYALQGTPNFEEKWHLHAPIDFGDYCGNHGFDVKTSTALLAWAKQKLFIYREKRIKPHRDEKIIVSWNSLVAKGLLQAGAAISDPEITAMGLEALDFIYKNLWIEGKLFSVFDGKHAKHLGYLDDYAFLLDALFFALQTSWNIEWALWAIELAEVLVTSFEDKEQGGFYFTSTEAERLLARPKPLMDEALSSGNAIASQALQRFGYLLGETRYTDAAFRAMEYAFPSIAETPFAYNSFLNVLEEYLNPPTFLIFRGKIDSMRAEKEKVSEHFSPHQFVFCIPEDAFVGHNAMRFVSNLQSLVSKKPQGDFVSYRCVGSSCTI